MSPQRIFASVALVIALGSLEKSIVTTPLSLIGQDLNAGQALTWVVTAYLLAATAVLPVYGKLSDIFGRVKMLNVSIVLFMLGSIACGLSDTLGQLIASRVLQGLGGGGLIALAFTVIADSIPARIVGKYQGYISIVYAVSSIAGPLLGGFFAEHLNWRWIFWVNLPLGILALWMVNRNLAHLSKGRKSPFDWKGAGLLISVTTLVLLLLSPESQLPRGWVASALLLALILLYIVEKLTKDPILPARLIRLPGYLVSVSLILCSQLLMFAVLVYFPLQLQWQKGLTASESGLFMMIFMFSITTGAFIGGKLIARWGNYKIFVILGFLMTSLALWQLHFDLGVKLALVFAGLGLGFTLPALSVVVQNVLPPRDRGIGMSLFNFGRELGGAIGVAVCAAIFHYQLPDDVLADSANGLAGVDARLLASGFNTTYLVMAAVAVIAFIMAIFALKTQSLADEVVLDE